MSFLPNTAEQLDGARFLGIDLAKKESQLSVLDAAGVEVLSLRFPTTRDNILALALELRPTDTVALEVNQCDSYRSSAQGALGSHRDSVQSNQNSRDCRGESENR